MKRYGLSKYERIKLRSEVKELFESNEKEILNLYPLKVLWVLKTATSNKHSGVKILVSVPHKKIKRAVKRNLIKRRIREAYRLNKLQLVAKAKAKRKSILIAFVYVSSSVKKYAEIESAVKAAVQEMINRV